MRELKSGDIVRLRSGGPIMTVGDINDKLECHWFEGPKRQQFTFRAEMLMPVPPEDLTDEQIIAMIHSLRADPGSETPAA